ncbi:hypothetical protein [Kitasatospora sp. NPDC094011]|uniref:hypothetical protein n=1 Tax=Kitasatospora sp. NPDC094011 TaxID=3364090 RepID=UPI00381F21AE
MVVNRYAKAALATLGLLLLCALAFVLLGLLPAGSGGGSVLRLLGGAVLVGAALVWGSYVSRLLRSRR